MNGWPGAGSMDSDAPGWGAVFSPWAASPRAAYEGSRRAKDASAVLFCESHSPCRERSLLFVFFF